MRVKALQFVFLTPVLLSASCAYAFSATTPHKAVAAKHMASKHAEPMRVAAGRKGHPEPVKVAHSRAPAPKLHATARTHEAPHEVARLQAGRRPGRFEARSQSRSAPEPVARRQPAPIERRAPEAAPVASPAEPLPDDIQVTHDRKHHYSADPTASDVEPRKATADDFLTSFAEESAAEHKKAVVQHAEAKAPPPPQTLPAPKLHQLVAPEPTPSLVPVLYDKRGHLIVPAALKGSHEILLHQNEMADHDGLDRIQDDDDLLRLRQAKLLVAVPISAGLQSDERLPQNRRFCRPWTAQFLTALAKAHYAKFHTSLQVNSAVRTVEFQERLLLTNGNAAPAGGETASPHLTGQAIDLAKHGLSLTEIAWLRGYLLPLVQAGKVDVEEEFQQACFHISVYRKYLPQPAPKRDIATSHHVAGAALATAIR
jgi:hypothetical protein